MPAREPRTRGTKGLQTRRWSEPDSNCRSRSCKGLCCWPAIQDAGTKPKPVKVGSEAQMAPPPGPLKAVSFSVGPRVRIRLPPAASLRTIGSAVGEGSYRSDRVRRDRVSVVTRGSSAVRTKLTQAAVERVPLAPDGSAYYTDTEPRLHADRRQDEQALLRPDPRQRTPGQGQGGQSPGPDRP
jgi:hypothetical protein